MPRRKVTTRDSQITHLPIEYGDGCRHLFNELLEGTRLHALALGTPVSGRMARADDLSPSCRAESSRPAVS
jgi:hypothetical protein